jgi:DNA-binding NarL/FixJ family response regulator
MSAEVPPPAADSPAVITVHISEDSRELRKALRKWLELDGRITVVGEAADGEETLRGVADTQPDVALVDLGMPLRLGEDAVARIRAAAPNCRVVVLSGSEPDAVGAVAGDADAYLCKPAPLPELADLVCAVVRGEQVELPA